MSISVNYWVLFNLYWIFLALVVSSCRSPDNENQVPTLSFDYSEIGHGNWDEIIFDNDLVRLEVTENSLITSLNKVDYYNQKIFALDIRQQKLFVFDESGDFIFRFETGLGAEEDLKSIRDFNIYEDEIYILDYQYVKIFDLKGKYLRKVNVPVEKVNSFSFAVIDKNTSHLWVQNDVSDFNKREEKSRLWKLTSDGQIENHGISSLYTGVSWGNIFGYSPNGRTLIPYVNRNEVFNIERDEVSRKFILDFGPFDISKKQNLLASVSSDLELHRLFISAENKICGLTLNFIETDQFYFFSNMCHGQIRHNFIFKGSKKRTFFDLTSNKSWGVYPSIVHGIRDNRIISSMMSVDVLNLIGKSNSGELDHLSRKQKALLKSLSDYTNIDNPIIVLSTLKSNF